MTVVPFLRYSDAPAALRFLCDVFGFEEGLVAPGAGGTIAHAEVWLGEGAVMIGTVRPDRGLHGVRTPRELGGGSSGIHVCVPDVDAHHARAKAAGAEIVQALEDGAAGRSYVALDLEGNLWSFGSYAPSVRPTKGLSASLREGGPS